MTKCAPADKAAIDAFSSKETSDITDIVHRVIKGKIDKASVEQRIALINCPNKFLDGKDGFIMTVIMEKARPLYDFIASIGLVWAMARVIPVATENTAPLHIYLGLDKVKLLSLDPSFIEQLEAGSDVAIDRIVECFLPMPRNPISPENVYGSTRKQRGGKRGRKTSKQKKNLYKS